MPCRRAITLANDGRYDGEVGKIPGTTNIYKNLISVQAPIFEIEGVAFTRTVTRPISTWQDLDGLKVGIVSGQLFAEDGTNGFNPIVASDFSQLLSLLAVGRIDVGIGLRQDYLVMQSDLAPKYNGIGVVGEPLFVAPLYHMVHKKHQAVADQLTLVLQSMWEDGTTARLHKKTLKLLTQKGAEN